MTGAETGDPSAQGNANVVEDRAGISDHCPVIAELRLEEAATTRIYRKSYTKLSLDDLKDESVRQKVLAAWQNDPPSVTYPRVRWDLAWRRVKSVIKEARRVKKTKRNQPGRSGKHRSNMETETRTGKLIRQPGRIPNCTGMLREKDEAEAQLWRYRSRFRWMTESEAPTNYFFSLWKVNMKQEEISMLQPEDGSVTENREVIRREIGNFYKNFSPKKGKPDERYMSA
ncbi:hypothetical protein R1sor_011429 [Riccia sorocarpa]|uniref:Endonuclease/exonuclease/phosphatase domain-containing protein n=1 Tax=Riccia sorocarpa TaxID=122646 RepID=A0ABD3I0Y0_9MARC